MCTPMLADATTWLTDHALLLIGAVVVVVGLAVVGRTDVPRFSGKRVWAISGVCFAESVRRRVLWIIPLAIVGLVAIVQLQQPSDEQDAIRQTTKFCLFAAGLVVVLSTLILACTNLPREIENRVIFLVVTKPTTRLEVVLGKVVGFARVSFVILLVMGLFTWGYLHLRAHLLTADLRDRLATPGAVEAISVPTFRHYVDAGLLNAKSLADPVTMDIYGRPPVPGSPRRYLNAEGYMLVPFQLPPNLVAYADPEGKQSPGPGLRVVMHVGYDPAPPPAPATTGAAKPPAATKPAGPPTVAVQVFDQNANSILSGSQAVVSTTLADPDGTAAVTADFPNNAVAQLARQPFVYIVLSPGTAGPSYWVNDGPADHPVTLLAPVTDAAAPRRLTPIDPAHPDRPGVPTFTGREGSYGQQVKGDPKAASQTCVFRFRDLRMSVPAGATSVPIEMRVGVEKSGETSSQDVPTDMRMTVTDADGRRSAEVNGLHPENNRPLYGTLPADLARSGDFDVSVQCLSPDQWIGLKPHSLSVVRGEEGFGWNLTKSLAVLWLLSILVTAISVFCSTFLTWPTAVVFTLVLLLGRWALNELGDAASAGLGRQFVTEFGVRDVALTTTVATSVDKLNSLFKTVAAVLPDISAFSATDNIDRGVSIPPHTLLDAGWVLVGFGLPLTVAAYVILKNKEVAP